MKKLLFLLIVLGFVACNQGEKKDREKPAAPKEVAEATIDIGGMHCNNCVASVEKGINGLEGIENVVVSLSDSTAVVRYDAQKVGLEEIEEAVVKRGYKVKKSQ